SPGPTRQQLLRDNQALGREVAELWRWVDRAVELTTARLQQFAATAAGMGLSLTQAHDLLRVLASRLTPSRSALGRWVQAAGAAAGAVLRRLDARCKPLVRTGCLDEIFFHGRPVLVGVEPASMAWFLGRKVHALRGSAWAELLRGWDGLRHVIADAGVALQ